MAERVGILVKLDGVARFIKDAKASERAVKGIGNAGHGMGRQLDKSGSSIAQWGARGALAFGAVSVAAPKATAAVGALGATVAPLGGLLAAAGAGGLAGAQGLGVFSLATKDLAEAYGGNAKALERLSPEAKNFYDTLKAYDPVMSRIRKNAQEGLFGGATKGLAAAAQNTDAFASVTERTSKVLGGLAQDAGGILGSKSFGADLKTVGASNARILDDLGHAGLFLADAARDVLVEAGPLTEWLAGLGREGARDLRNWIHEARETGDLAQYFESTKDTLIELGEVVRPVAHGIGNLFDAAKPGTRKNLLNDLEQLAYRFERVTRGGITGDEVGKGISQAFEIATPAIANAAGKAFAEGAPRAVSAFARAWWDSDPAGKIFIGAVLAAKLGLFSKLGKTAAGMFAGGFNGGGGPLGGGKGGKGLAGRGSSPANPVFVSMGAHVPPPPGNKTTPVPTGGPGSKGKAGKKVGRKIASKGARALPFVGTAAAAVDLGWNGLGPVLDNQINKPGPSAIGKGNVATTIQLNVDALLDGKGVTKQLGRTNRNTSARKAK